MMQVTSTARRGDYLQESEESLIFSIKKYGLCIKSYITSWRM
jgi:hypothetical protein